jgi:hypothetical protein
MAAPRRPTIVVQASYQFRSKLVTKSWCKLVTNSLVEASYQGMARNERAINFMSALKKIRSCTNTISRLSFAALIHQPGTEPTTPTPDIPPRRTGSSNYLSGKGTGLARGESVGAKRPVCS